MTPKKVWGIILIILGLLAIFKGASDIQQVEDFNTMMKFLGVGQVFSGKEFSVLNFEKVKSDAMLGSCLGIGMAIIGTLMLKDTTSNKQKRIMSDEGSLGKEPIMDSGEKYACSAKENTELFSSFANDIKINNFEKPRIIDMRTGKDESAEDSIRGEKD